MDGDLTEDGLEGAGPRLPASEAATAFTVASLKDQLLVGLLDEGSEEPALHFEDGLMGERLDLVGEMLVLLRQG